MECWTLAPLVLALVLFLLVGSLFERRIEGAWDQFTEHRRVQLALLVAEDQRAEQRRQQQHTTSPPPQQRQGPHLQELHLRDSAEPYAAVIEYSNQGIEVPSSPVIVKTSNSNTSKKSLRSLRSATNTDKQNVVVGANQSDTSTKADLVARIKARVAAADPAKARELGGVFLFNIIRGTAVYSWTMDLNKVTVYEGEPPEDPDTTFTLNEHIFKQLVTGREDPRVIMQAGRCSVTGDIMRAMKLEPYIKLE